MTEWLCPACGETQLALGAQVPPADRLCHACQARRERKPLARLLAEAGVPRGFRRCTTRQAWIEHFHRLLFVLGDWPLADDRWLCLWGPTGTGKTSAATVLLAEHLGGGGRGLWMDGMTIREELAREMDAGGERTLLARLIRTPLLVLDEPFAGHVTPYAADRMLLLIRQRDQNDGRTVVTSQLGPEELMSFASDSRFLTGSVAAAASRILSGQVIEIDGPDERLARAQGGSR
jgi:hypothetical protein